MNKVLYHEIKTNINKHFQEKIFAENAHHPKEVRLVLRNYDVIHSDNIDVYILKNGYEGLNKVLTNKSSFDVIKEIKEAKLRDRRKGYNTGDKLENLYYEESKVKYVVCNGEEGGANKDRTILEKDPHAVIEGLILTGFAIGANKGYIYIPAESSKAIKRIEKAITDAKKYSFLGENILGSTFDFNIELRIGAGAFICTEDTALISALEGKRGVSNLDTDKGLFGEPTYIADAETLANITLIMNHSASWYRQYGTKESPGTKVLTLAGKVKNPGVIEVPMGITLKEIIYEIGGGMANKNYQLKSVLIGGTTGRCLTKDQLNITIDCDLLTELDSVMESGSITVIDESENLVGITKSYMDFLSFESCGRCTPCREGTRVMNGLLNKVMKGDASFDDLTKLKEVANTVKKTSLCNFGQKAPNMVLDTIKYYQSDYLDYINVLKSSKTKEIEYYITDKCIGCMTCVNNCPVQCISGQKRQKAVIDSSVCVRCGGCFKACPVKAIITK